jgi:hypothetical protein
VTSKPKDPAMSVDDGEAAANRGHRPSLGPGGEVRGSGAGAGPGGNPEDYDGDVAAAGSGPARSKVDQGRKAGTRPFAGPDAQDPAR